MQNSVNLPLAFLAEQTINLDTKNNILVQYGSVSSSSESHKAILISRPKLPSSLNLQSLALTSQTHTFCNDIYHNYSVTFPTEWELKFIYPSTEKLYKKYKKKQKQLLKETPEQYKSKDLSKEIQHNKWVYNILEGLAEAERVVFKEEGKEGFILIPDSDYLDKQKDEMHYLGIVNDRSLHSLRDLNQSHMSMLKTMREKMREVITQQLGDDYTYRQYLHYPPTFYHLHIHFTSLQIEGPTVQMERCHDLTQVIRNLELDKDYYKNATLNVLKNKLL